MEQPDTDTGPSFASASPSEVEALLCAHLPHLRTFVRATMHPALRAQESCSDVVQSVCREFLEKAPSFDYRSDAGFKCYLLRWARNKLRDRMKFHTAERRRSKLADGPVDPDWTIAETLTPSEEAMTKEELDLLRGAVDELAEADREVVTLCRILGLSREDAGMILGCSAAAVGSRLNRALVRLSKRLVRHGV